MPRFHFDVVEDGVTVSDDEGLDLSSVDAARLEAARTAAEIMKDRTGRKAEPANVSIVIRDSRGTIGTVTVALQVEWHRADRGVCNPPRRYMG